MEEKKILTREDFLKKIDEIKKIPFDRKYTPEEIEERKKKFLPNYSLLQSKPLRPSLAEEKATVNSKLPSPSVNLNLGIFNIARPDEDG